MIDIIQGNSQLNIDIKIMTQRKKREVKTKGSQELVKQQAINKKDRRKKYKKIGS